MSLTRRDILKASAAVAGALGLTGAGIFKMREALAREGAMPVLWFQAQACTGCTISLANSIYYTTLDKLLTDTLDMEYHPNLSAAAGPKAIEAIEDTYTRGGYILVVEGAIPFADGGKACYLWPGTTAYNGIVRFAARAKFLVAVGTCASYGGMAAGHPNPTNAKPLKAVAGKQQVINIPGCPVHPDWVVGTIASLLKNNRAPALDAYGRPRDYFGIKVHDKCPLRDSYTGPAHHSKGRPCSKCHSAEDVARLALPASKLSAKGCLFNLGCKGPQTFADCPTRRWNSPAPQTAGVNWCIGARSPCFGCTEPNFPDGKSPFYIALAAATAGDATGGPQAPDHSNGATCTTCHSANDPRIRGGQDYTGTGYGAGQPAGHSGGKACTSCHPANDPRIRGAGGQGAGGRNQPPAHSGGKSCTTCHAASDPRIQGFAGRGGAQQTASRTGGKAVPPAHAGGQVCTTCHGRSDPRIQGFTSTAATRGVAPAGPSRPDHSMGQACQTCHSGNDPRIQGYGSTAGAPNAATTRALQRGAGSAAEGGRSGGSRQSGRGDN